MENSLVATISKLWTNCEKNTCYFDWTLHEMGPLCA